MHGHWLDVCKVILGFFKHCFGHVIIGIWILCGNGY
jgi:hypothetical protein